MTIERNYAHLANALRQHGGVVNFQDGQLEVIYADAELDPAVIAGIEQGPFDYGLFIKEEVPVLLLGAQEFKMDFFLNVHDLLATRARGGLSNYKGLFSFSLVHASTYDVVAHRSFICCQWFVRLLKDALYEQRRRYRNSLDIFQVIDEQSTYLATDSMFAAAKLYSEPAMVTLAQA